MIQWEKQNPQTRLSEIILGTNIPTKTISIWKAFRRYSDLAGLAKAQAYCAKYAYNKYSQALGLNRNINAVTLSEFIRACKYMEITGDTVYGIRSEFMKLIKWINTGKLPMTKNKADTKSEAVTLKISRSHIDNL